MLDTALQQAIEEQKKVSSSQKIYTFNPNFISDSKGYYLSLSVDQIDRLYRYRSQGKWVNSANDFQQVTGVSETWMNQYAPYFKFPFHKRTFNSKKKTCSTSRPKYGFCRRFNENQGYWRSVE